MATGSLFLGIDSSGGIDSATEAIPAGIDSSFMKNVYVLHRTCT